MEVLFFTSTGRLQSLAFNLASAQHPEHTWRRLVLDTPERRAEFEAAEHSPGVIVSFLNPYVVPGALLDAVEGRAFNVHPARPDHPGAQAFHFAAYSGDWTAAATLHRMVREVDAGEILDVLEAPGDASEGIAQMVERSKELGVAILLRNLDTMLAGTIEPNGRRWASGPRHTEADFEAICRIDPSLDAAELERRVAAFYSPERGTPYVELHGARFVYSPREGRAGGPAANGAAGLAAAEVMAFVVATLEEPLRDAGIGADQVGEDFDLYSAGLIDSFGLIELIAAVEEQFALEIDFEELDPESMTVLGPLATFIAARASA